MARKNPSILQEELYPAADEPLREDIDDARTLDLDAEQESPFLRGQKRVSVRRGSIPKKTANRLTWAAIVVTVLFFCGLATAALYHYGERSWRFRIDSSDDIELAGLENVGRSQVMEVMGGDIGRNIFFVPLAQRKAQLEQIPWVESASVMRFVPNRLRVELHERTPVAFARVGSRILLADAGGALMEIPPGKKKFSFPVIIGMNSGEPLSTRSARMKIYNDVVGQLDSGGGHYSQDLSEVDLSDPEDVKVVASDPGGEVLVHLGSSNYLDRYKIYVTHVRDWRQQFDKLESVDLRYDRQIIVNPDTHASPKAPPLTLSAAKAAVSAGVKPAALIQHETISKAATAIPTPSVKTSSKPVVKQVSTKAKAKRPAWKKAKTKTGKAPVVKTAAKPASKPATQVASAKSKKPSPAIKDPDHQ